LLHFSLATDRRAVDRITHIHTFGGKTYEAEDRLRAVKRKVRTGRIIRLRLQPGDGWVDAIVNFDGVAAFTERDAQ
jgi:hypothetical protein